MNSPADSFQRDFIRAIYDDESADESAPLAALVRQPGFRVYRNTVLKACVDALAANYPTVEQLVGTEWFRAAALLHARVEPPESVCLIEYGQRFASFLRNFPAAAGLPYLADVAQLDRDWMECHIAADEPVLDAGYLAALEPDTLLRSVLRPRAAVRWRWCKAYPAYAIWHANRMQQPADVEQHWHGDGALLSRIDGVVQWQAASIGTCAFLDACAAGVELQVAVAAALHHEPALDVASLLSSLIQAQAFTLPVAITSA